MEFGELLDTLVLCELSWHSLVCLGWCLDGVCVFAGLGWFRACFSSYLSLRLVTICLVWCLLVILLRLIVDLWSLGVLLWFVLLVGFVVG